MKIKRSGAENREGMGKFNQVIRISGFPRWDDHSQYKGFRPQYGWNDNISFLEGLQPEAKCFPL